MLKRSLLSAVTVFVCLLGAEIYLRLTVADTIGSQQYRVPHPVLGWSLLPNASYLNKMDEGAVRVTYSSQGWRDRPHHMARKARGELRIAVLGDSFMEGYSVGDDDHFSRRLEINLVENGTATEVLNFGVGGYSPLQSYLAFKTEASQYRPDIVLLGMFLENDLREMKPESKKLAAGAWGLKSDARPYLKDSDPNNFATFQWNYAQAVRNYESNLAQRNQRFELVKLVQRAYLRTQEPTVAETPLSAEESCKDYEESWLLTEKVLSKLRDDTAAVEARLVVFSVPGPALKYIDTGCPAQRVPERLASVLGRLHIPYVDLFPLFEHETNERGEAATFSNTDHHWNETGHLLAAQAVGEALRVRHNVRSYR